MAIDANTRRALELVMYVCVFVHVMYCVCICNDIEVGNVCVYTMDK